MVLGEQAFDEIIFSVHIFVSFSLTGLILLVQFVHYPSFKYVESSNFFKFQKFHMRSISYIVAPLMLIEIISGSYLLIDYNQSTLFIISVVMIYLIWLNTIFWNVPMHSKLLDGKELAVINKLITSNWPRTVLWTIRSAILIYILNQLIG